MWQENTALRNADLGMQSGGISLGSECERVLVHPCNLLRALVQPWFGVIYLKSEPKQKVEDMKPYFSPKVSMGSISCSAISLWISRLEILQHDSPRNSTEFCGLVGSSARKV